jgi:hypothetical protein
MDPGREVKYGGVLVGEVLARAGAPLGKDFSGPAFATYVVATGRDGYAAVFSFGVSRCRIPRAPAASWRRTTDAACAVRMLQKLEVVRLRK